MDRKLYRKQWMQKKRQMDKMRIQHTIGIYNNYHLKKYITIN